MQRLKLSEGVRDQELLPLLRLSAVAASAEVQLRRFKNVSETSQAQRQRRCRRQRL